MKTLALIILSIEKLGVDPIGWFSTKPWLFKLLFIIITIPLISIQSIFWYEKITYTKNLAQKSELETQLNLLLEIKQNQAKLLDEQAHEFADIKKDIAIFKEIYNTSLDATITEDVLGAQTAVINENLRDRLQTSEVDATTHVGTTQIYIRSDLKNIAAFTQPSSSSSAILGFDTTSMYPALSEKGDWQQIDLGEGKTAWIEKKFILKLPINEKP